MRGVPSDPAARKQRLAVHCRTGRRRSGPGEAQDSGQAALQRLGGSEESDFALDRPGQPRLLDLAASRFTGGAIGDVRQLRELSSQTGSFICWPERDCVERRINCSAGEQHSSFARTGFVRPRLQVSPQHIQTDKRIADRLSFLGCTPVIQTANHEVGEEY